MFSRSKANKDGYQTRCKECLAKYYVANRAKVVAKQREHYTANRDHRLSVSRATYEANKDSAAVYHKERRERLKDILPAQKAAWYAANKSRFREARLEYAKAWRVANPDKTAAMAAKRRAMLINATPPWVNYAEIAAFYEDAKTLETIFGWPFHVDHTVPLNHPLVSGLHVPANLQILNASDNLSKSNTFHI
jgi:hypothetical protein